MGMGEKFPDYFWTEENLFSKECFLSHYGMPLLLCSRDKGLFVSYWLLCQMVIFKIGIW